jgi:hypothetical protein
MSKVSFREFKVYRADTLYTTCLLKLCQISDRLDYRANTKLYQLVGELGKEIYQDYYLVKSQIDHTNFYSFYWKFHNPFDNRDYLTSRLGYSDDVDPTIEEETIEDDRKRKEESHEEEVYYRIHGTKRPKQQ